MRARREVPAVRDCEKLGAPWAEPSRAEPPRAPKPSREWRSWRSWRSRGVATPRRGHASAVPPRPAPAAAHHSLYSARRATAPASPPGPGRPAS